MFVLALERPKALVLGLAVGVVSADLRTLTRVWMGDVRLAETVRAGLIRLEGPPALVRAFPTWLTLSAFAGVERVGASVTARPA
jgi:hypothetical protein